MYYHVIVETTEKNKKDSYVRFYERDCENFDDIVDLIVKPYLNNEKIYIDGRYIDRDEVRQLKIKESRSSLSELRDFAQSTVRPGMIMVYTQIMVLDNDRYVTDITKDTLKSVGEIIKIGPAETKAGFVDKKKIFIVHGRDDHAKIETARFIEKFGLEAIILHEQVNSGKTIIEKIEAHTNVGFAVVLYTPCDVGGLSGSSDVKPRARQNVVFEHGYLIGKLGRQNVCALVKGDVETPNDISGVVYLPLDINGAWKLSLAKELRSSGYEIDMNRIM